MRSSTLPIHPVPPPANCMGCPTLERCLQARGGGERDRRAGRFTSRHRTLQCGDALVRAGDAFRSLFVLRSGSLKCCSPAHAGPAIVTEFLLPGDVVELGSIADRRHHVDVLALEDSVVCAVPLARLESRSVKDPTLRTQLCRLMSAELNRLSWRRTLLASKTSLEQVATFLDDLDERMNPDASEGTLTLSMPRQDIASYLNINPATISRCLAALCRLGVIAVNGREVRILDRAALRATAGERRPVH